MASRRGGGVLLEHVGGVYGVIWVERGERCSLREVCGGSDRSSLENVRARLPEALGTCSASNAMNSAESPEIPLAADVATILFYFATITIV
jgi:hypothetical protein